MSQINTNAILDASGGTTATVNGYTPTASNMAGRNRIINGDMRIDQRAVTSVSSGTENYTLDRWVVANYFLSNPISVAQSSDAPAGFTKSLLVTNGTGEALSAADYGVVRQKIEGYNFAEMAWGTASAKAITISFWVKSSVVGNYTVGLINGALNRANRTVFTINSANTWEQKTVTFAGDTSGTWATDNSIGLYLDFLFVAGSNQYATADTWTSNTLEGVSGASATWVTSTNATFYITGVQLEAGSVATPFEHRQYGQELALCQRYYEKGKRTYVVMADDSSHTHFNGHLPFLVSKRTSSGTGTATATSNIGPGGTPITSISVGPSTEGMALFTQSSVSNTFGAVVADFTYAYSAEL